MSDAETLATLFESLAAGPRPAGGAAEAAARTRCAEMLRQAGYCVTEEPFEYSAFPGRWGTPVVGLASLLTLAAVAHLGAHGQPAAALALLALAGAALAAAGTWMARRGVLGMPLLRRRGVNLVAARGEPRVWLVAHLDSKSQPVPIAVRALGVLATGAMWVGALALAVAQLAGLPVTALWAPLAIGGAVAALPIVLSTVGSRSPGALDNASGVATVMGAALRLPSPTPVGVVLTSAEELGLAGARAWALGRPPGVAVNVDGVDDRGAVTLMYTGRPPEPVLRAFAEAAASTAAKDMASQPRSRRLLPGILTDGVALADAGWAVVTVSRGRWRTLLRIHRPADDLRALRGSALVPTARLVAAAAHRLAGG